MIRPPDLAMRDLQALDRHALVMAIWLPAGLVGASLLHYGTDRAGAACILGGFAAIVVAFIGHVLVNAAYRTGFSPRERALGLVLYVVALLGFVLTALIGPALPARAFVSLCGGFILLFAVVVFTMLTSYGTRGAFEAFDVIRSFRATAGSAARDEEDGGT